VNNRCQTTNPKQHSGACVLRVGEQMDRGKNFMACLRGAVNEVQKKKRIVDFMKTLWMFKILVSFLGGSSLGRVGMPVSQF
jgi:hypothetical protein